MQYIEALPDDILTRHIESYWSMSCAVGSSLSPIELLLPTCTFNIIFVDQPCFVQLSADAPWLPMEPGAVFFGQRKSYIRIKSDHVLTISGIRFKPFAFANVIKLPIVDLNDSVLGLGQVFSLKNNAKTIISQINQSLEMPVMTSLMDELMFDLFKESLIIDDNLRAQLNYIMDRKGAVRVGELVEEFKVSKVTLRKHFIKKVGLTPKKVSQIWRMNYFLNMREHSPSDTLTSLCLSAGFYDQAHFIKDFRLLFGMPPGKFFSQNSDLLRIANHNISRRFNNQYDPRIGSLIA